MRQWLVEMNVREQGAIGIFWSKWYAVDAATREDAGPCAAEKAREDGYETCGWGLIREKGSAS